MLRAILRFLGYLVLSLGFVAFVVDGARYVANNEWSFLSFGSVIDIVMPRAQAGWETLAKQRLPGFLWDPVLVHTLMLPFFLVATVIGVLLLFLARKPKPKIGYSTRD